MRKLTYGFVKEQIEKEGYKLLSKEYINANTKLKIKCDNNHNYETSYNNFKQGNRCPECRKEKLSKKIKLTYEFIKEQFEQEGYRLLSKEYINSQSKLEVKCPKNHIYKVKYGHFQQGQRCLKCLGIKNAKQQKHTYEYIKEQIEKEGYKLLSKEYKNNHTKLKMKCSFNHISHITYGNFLSGYRCKICSIKIRGGKRKLSYYEVKNNINNIGYDLLSIEYINAHTKLKIQCDKKHEYFTTYATFYCGHRCPICDAKKTSSKPEKEIVKYVKELNLNTKIIENDRTKIINPKTNRMLELDIWMPELKKAIEFNGKFWHNNEYQKYKDKQKVKQCKEKGIDLLVISEQDYINDKEKCLNEIKRFI